MSKKYYLFPAFLCLVSISLFGQNPVVAVIKSRFNLHLGTNVGGGQLFHNTRFQSTTLNNLYQTIAISHRPDDYTWNEFEKDYAIRNTFQQPRFGLNATLTYGNIPFFLDGEYMSSTSSYQKMSAAVTFGMGRDFQTLDLFFLSARCGYKFVIRDAGFGAETLVNSIGNREARRLIATYFDPVNPLGRPSGSLLAVRGGFGKWFGPAKKSSMGIEVYGELDVTDSVVRESRMNSVGINAYFRFNLLDLLRKEREDVYGKF